MKDSKFHTYISQNLSNEIRLADTKAAWVFSVVGLTSAAMTNKISKLSLEKIMETKNTILIVIAAVLLVLAIKHVMAVIYPRLRKGNNKGLMYFRDITESTREEYIKKSTTLSDEEVVKEFAGLAHDLSGVVGRKFHHLRVAMIYAVLALLAVVAFISFF